MQHSSFHEAAVHLGLFHHENEGQLTMTEAVASFQTPNQLRFLFVRLILEGYATVPLWTEFKYDLARDYMTTFRDEGLGVKRTLQCMAESLRDHDRQLQDFGMPQASYTMPEILSETLMYAPRQTELRSTALGLKDNMNDEQHHIYDHLLQTVIQHEQDMQHYCLPAFIEGKPGRGKTYIINCLSCELRSLCLIVLIVGTTGLAATLYEGGRTAHNLFCVPVSDVSDTNMLCPQMSLTKKKGSFTTNVHHRPTFCLR